MKKRIRILNFLVLLGLALPGVGLTATQTSPESSDAEGKTTVVIVDYTYEPKELTIKVGTTVTWINKDSAEHTATDDNESFDTDLLSYGESASVTFSNPGSFNYHCAPHPFMKGIIQVE